MHPAPPKSAGKARAHRLVPVDGVRGRVGARCQHRHQQRKPPHQCTNCAAILNQIVKGRKNVRECSPPSEKAQARQGRTGLSQVTACGAALALAVSTAINCKGRFDHQLHPGKSPSTASRDGGTCFRWNCFRQSCWLISYEKQIKLKMLGHEVHYTNSLMSIVKNMLCIEFHCQKVLIQFALHVSLGGFSLREDYMMHGEFLACWRSLSSTTINCKGRFDHQHHPGNSPSTRVARDGGTRVRWK